MQRAADPSAPKPLNDVQIYGTEDAVYVVETYGACDALYVPMAVFTSRDDLIAHLRKGSFDIPRSKVKRFNDGHPEWAHFACDIKELMSE